MPKNRTAARQAVFMSALALLPVAAAAAAAVDEAALPRVEVTGSHLLRTVGEGSAPLRTVSRDEIERSVAASVADLLARLPRMQGMQTLSESVGNDGNGVTTASLHGLGAR
ncbi:MAG: iron complex outerrane recepter protein, partial [Pseudomonadota bacterium]|nr:iron complex outerrane recepter protein [Pseudomonadota bacterium]